MGEIKKILLTASGGPFYGKTVDELRNVTPAQALKHPNWSMGRKITIDCIVGGAFSALSGTGTHQLFKQLLSKKEEDK